MVILRWFEHVERMDEYRMATTMLIVELSEVRVRGRSRLGGMGAMKVTIGSRGMTVETARQGEIIGKSGELVHM